MSNGTRQRRGVKLLAKTANAFRLGDRSLSQIDPDGLRYVANIQVWLHWALGVLVVVLLLYRPSYGYWAPQSVAYLVILVLLMVVNGYLHYCVLSKKTMTWRWVFAFSAMDIILLSAAVAISGGFSHYFFHLLYYPPLAIFALVIASFRVNMALVTMVAVIYLVLCLMTGDGLDFVARDEKALLVRDFRDVCSCCPGESDLQVREKEMEPGCEERTVTAA